MHLHTSVQQQWEWACIAIVCHLNCAYRYFRTFWIFDDKVIACLSAPYMLVLYQTSQNTISGCSSARQWTSTFLVLDTVFLFCVLWCVFHKLSQNYSLHLWLVAAHRREMLSQVGPQRPSGSPPRSGNTSQTGSAWVVVPFSTHQLGRGQCTGSQGEPRIIASMCRLPDCKGIFLHVSWIVNIEIHTQFRFTCTRLGHASIAKHRKNCGVSMWPQEKATLNGPNPSDCVQSKTNLIFGKWFTI